MFSDTAQTEDKIFVVFRAPSDPRRAPYIASVHINKETAEHAKDVLTSDGSHAFIERHKLAR